MRVAPGGDAATHLEVLRRHLEDHVPWGAHVTVTAGDVRAAVRDRRDRSESTTPPGGVPSGVGSRSGRAWAWRVHPVHRRVRRDFPGRDDSGDRRRGPGTQAHSVSESLDLGVLEGLRSPRRCCFDRLGD